MKPDDIKVHLYYTGEGGICLTKNIVLPFVPFEGLTIQEKTIDDGTVFDEYVLWDVNWQMVDAFFECSVRFGLGTEIFPDGDKLMARGWELPKA